MSDALHEPVLTTPGSAPLSQRQLKVGETMRHQLAEWLMRGEVHDAALGAASVTVSEVRTSRDLRQATAFVSVLGATTVPSDVLLALNRAAGLLGGRLARELHLKYAPKLRFEADDRYEEAARIEALLLAARTASDDGA